MGLWATDEPLAKKGDHCAAMNQVNTPLHKPGRRRSAASHQAILQATLELFAEVGLAGLSIEALAERAGVGKTTIYRRWSAKEDILSDALYLLRGGNPLPDTGHMRDDLLYLARASRESYARDPFMGRLITKMMAELKTNPKISRAFVEKVIAPRIQEFRPIVERAQRRGEVREDLDATFILLLIFLTVVLGGLFIEFIDPEGQHVYAPETVVDTLLRGIAAAAEETGT
ncbi:MAG: TetR family transcriptional regulator [Chloroflexi bacterium]|nr:MAG: TetR family transcriptional regulator [Chloroflexota bacterium]